jgi:hypothetical protein
MELKININSEFKACHSILKQNLFDKGGIPTISKIHQALNREHHGAHSCFGCSLADTVLLISNYLHKYGTFADIKEDLSSYILLQNLLVDRLDTILDIVNMPKEMREKEFFIFKKISAWAYFLKRHTAFISKYQTLYVLENKLVSLDFEAYSLIVNYDFVDKYYKARLNKGNFLTEFVKMGYKLERLNEKPILLVIPNIADITNQLCGAVNHFTDMLLNEKKYFDLYFKSL